MAFSGTCGRAVRGLTHFFRGYLPPKMPCLYPLSLSLLCGSGTHRCWDPKPHFLYPMGLDTTWSLWESLPPQYTHFDQDNNRIQPSSTCGEKVQPAVTSHKADSSFWIKVLIGAWMQNRFVTSSLVLHVVGWLNLLNWIFFLPPEDSNILIYWN